MLTYNDLKTGVLFIMDGEPYEVLDYQFLRKQQRKPVAKAKIKNLITGKVIERNFHPNENFEEAELEKKEVIFIYSHRGEFWFKDKDDVSKRFCLKEETLGSTVSFLKPNSPAAAVCFNGKVINIDLPPKVDLKVAEAPPGEKGNTAQGGTKTVVLETGAKISAPLFVEIGDTVKVNTQTGEYVERVLKES